MTIMKNDIFIHVAMNILFMYMRPSIHTSTYVRAQLWPYHKTHEHARNATAIYSCSCKCTSTDRGLSGEFCVQARPRSPVKWP